MPGEFKTVAQINYWLCRVKRDDSQVIEEINKVDFSDKKEIYQLALLALKNEVDNFFKILPSVLESKQLSVEKLEEFPIFGELRKTESYKKFKEGSPFFRNRNHEDAELQIKNSVSESSESFLITNQIGESPLSTKEQ